MNTSLLASNGRHLLRQRTVNRAIAIRYSSGGGGYNQPTGKLFGEDRPEGGVKRGKEDWENLWYFGMFGGMALGTVLILYKPDTTIQTWAMKEAKKSLEGKEGVWKYEPSANSGHPNGA
ncbi:hypothetical protein CBS101457_000824 [Exobasidium rhododendri]|nr:hypothetical protein CBS101457_000824 [Exobasidium rhododendri]